MIGVYGEVYAPIVKGEGYLHSIQKFNSYSHIINAVGGFWSASLGLSVRQSQAEDWYESGLGRQIITKNQAGGKCFKGFANMITITAGSQTLTRGPLLDIGNQVRCIYSPRYYPNDGGPSVTVSSVKTPWEDDQPSQLDYGVLEKTFTAGTTSDASAIKRRDTFLLQNKLPKTTGDFSITGMGQPLSMTLDLLGNIHWLSLFTYNNRIEAIYTVYDKILQILAANPNAGTISTNYHHIDANIFPAEQLEDKDRTGWDILNEMLALGNDTNDIRRVLGLYEDDVVWYGAIPSTLAYEYRLASQHQEIKDYHTEVVVHPWDVRPARWIRTPDWLIGRKINSTDLYNDPRNKFIESVNFTAPFTVGLTGSPYDELAQRLAKITYIGGIYG